jgi:hypothetical protein
MTRQQHLEWCKKRAHEYLARGDVENAIASMLSDLNKHDETKLPSGSPLNMLGMMAAMNNDRSEAARFIDGFN